MASLRKYVIPALLIFLIFAFAEGKHPRQKFEKKFSFDIHSFSPLTGSIPGWEYGGDAVVMRDGIRLTPAEKEKKGALWTESPTNFSWWQVHMLVHIYGTGDVGGDGLAFWYTKEKGNYNGTVFGSSDYWTGLGVIFDTFDNDDKDDNPYVAVILNDGSTGFDHENDGSTQVIGSCQAYLRNTPYRVHIKIEYYLHTLNISYYGGAGLHEGRLHHELCVSKKNLFLPEFGYFGISAATGHLVDNHFVYHFFTISYTGVKVEVTTERLPDLADARQLIKDYTEKKNKLIQEKKEQGLQWDPDKLEEEDFNFDGYRLQEEYDPLEDDDLLHNDGLHYGGDSTDDENLLDEHLLNDDEDNDEPPLHVYPSKVLKQVNKLKDELGDLMKRQKGGIKVEKMGEPDSSEKSYTPDQEEMNALLKSHKNMVATIHQIRDLALDVNFRVDKVLRHQENPPRPVCQFDNSNVKAMLDEVRTGFMSLQSALHQFGEAPSKESTFPSCVNFATFSAVIFSQLIIILAYLNYLKHREYRPTKAKKHRK